MIILFMAYRKEKAYEKKRDDYYKRQRLYEELFEKCIDFWPEMFDGIECKIDNDGNGVPDEDENCADYF